MVTDVSLQAITPVTRAWFHAPDDAQYVAAFQEWSRAARRWVRRYRVLTVREARAFATRHGLVLPEASRA